MKQLSEKTQKIINISLTALFAVAVVLFIITFSIGLPIYCRFFYFMQIEKLGIPEDTGKTVAEIKEAYNQMMDYLTLPNTTFSTGVFRFSEDGASHFADCKGLFTLNTVTLIISTVILVATLVLSKLKLVKLYRPKGLSIAFYSAISIFIIGIIIGGLVSIDFDKAFTIFHKILFPRKDNWYFDPYLDQIILALPEQFFLNCAILIGSSLVLLPVGIIVFELIKKKKLSK